MAPSKKGEGAWALSRGFLVSGSHRAAASLVSAFCSGVAKGEKAGQVDYAQALHTAKKWVRDQEKWQSPYYWATFVLLGPN